MNQVVCTHPLIPIRSEPDHRSEQLSQLVFGETANVREKNGEWLEITTDFDNYTGWTENKSLESLTKQQNSHAIHIVSKPVFILSKGDQTICVPAGSEIPCYTADGEFVFGDKTFCLQDKLTPSQDAHSKNLIATSKQFLNAPYLWGGRTIFGLDCSGFVQMVFKIYGINLPRDAKDQSTQGTAVNKLKLVQAGDLLFFTNQEKIVSHVGIYMGNGKIIHASVSVRIDSIDNKGIYNAELKAYTHEFYCIRRLLPE